jgi:alkylation response protein AidB-like acyl-CoA dehydrogenase
MEAELNPQQQGARARFRDFARGELAPHAERFDREERLPRELIQRLAAGGYLAAAMPPEEGGMEPVTYGLLHEEFGRACSSTRSILTVHHMVTHAVRRWGGGRQKESVLPGLLRGEQLAAFALTEPNVGSDAAQVETEAVRADGSYVLNGLKKWITGGQLAGLFLVFARCEGRPAAFLVGRETPGLTVTPVGGMLGLRAAMLAELRLEDCRVAEDCLVGKVGYGVSHVAASALDWGRYGVAWGCVGIAQACLDACVRYTSERRQFGRPLKEHQLIQRMVADMLTGTRAARLVCLRAGQLRARRDASAMMETMVAKYLASTTAAGAAADAVQIHGAFGCSAESPVQRHMRDAKVMEIIEGSTQIQQIAVAQYAYVCGDA